MTPQTESEALTALLEYVRRQRGVDFSAYKASSMERRLEHRMQAIQARTISDYLDHLQATPEELNALLDTLFINVTGFFRDKAAWDVIAENVIPALLAANTSGQLRVWCAGVASGEEAYTVAILLAEAMGEAAFTDRVKLFATDADEGALTQGRAAGYSAKQLENVPEGLRKYFDASDDRFVFRSELRRSVIFGRHNLLEDAPISRLDLLICRNTMMYFNRDVQNRILARFHFALKPEGYLFLGKAETLLTRRHLFTALDPKQRVFRRVAHEGPPSRAVLAAMAEHAAAQGGLSQIRHSAFDTSPVAQILVDRAGRLAFANGAARSTFGIKTADIGRNFSELELSYRPLDLRTLIDHVKAEGKPVTVPSVERAFGGRLAIFDVTVVPLQDDAAEHSAFGIAFTDVTNAHELRVQLEASRGELETAYEELQSTNEELETTNEELQSTIEELETTNEELQSTNEELETMNEELQTTNDEIRQINGQLGERGHEVNRLNAYLRSILDGQEAAVVVLDNELNVSMWSKEARELWGLREDEVKRQPLMNLDIGLPVHELKDSIRRVLRGEQSMEQGVLAAHNRKGKAFECRVSVRPLRSLDNETMGVIVVMEPHHALNDQTGPTRTVVME